MAGGPTSIYRYAGADVCTGCAGGADGAVLGGVGDAVGVGGADWTERAGTAGGVGDASAEGIRAVVRTGSTAGVDGAGGAV